jgi:hypothetical protein
MPAPAQAHQAALSPVGFTVEPTQPPPELGHLFHSSRIQPFMTGKPGMGGTSASGAVRARVVGRNLDALDFSSSLDSKPKVPRALAWSASTEFPDLEAVGIADDAAVARALATEAEIEDRGAIVLPDPEPFLPDDGLANVESLPRADTDDDHALVARPRHRPLLGERSEPTPAAKHHAGDDIPVRGNDLVDPDLAERLTAKIDQIEYEIDNYDTGIEFDSELGDISITGASGHDETLMPTARGAEVDDESADAEVAVADAGDVAIPEDSADDESSSEWLNAYGKPATKGSRFLWGLMTFVLGMVLAAQAIYLFRVEIGRGLPGLRQLLTMACVELGCDMPLPRDVSLIRVVDSDLQSEPGRPGRYVFFATISNRAAFAQDWPYIELTLADSIDTPLIRRVILPAEWVPPERIGGAFRPRSDVSVRLMVEISGPEPSNYHIYPFYP